MEKIETFKLPITVLIMTQNEELNIGITLKSIINKFSQIIVVDSNSIDNTINICKNFQGVEIYNNTFIHWANQRNWMLENCNINNEWVFFLDADESINETFFKELKLKFNKKTLDINSFFINKDLFFLGKKLNFAYSHPKIRLIFNKNGLKYHAEVAREFASSPGNSLEIKTPLIHEDKRSFDHWIRKHISNADREVKLYFEKKEDILLDYNNIPIALKFRKYIRNNIWSQLPFAIRPLLYFIYRYIFKLGFLDGKYGFIFCINHALWYELLIDIKIIEKINSAKK